MQPPLPKSAFVCYVMPEKGLSTKYPQGIKLPSPVKVPLSMNESSLLIYWLSPQSSHSGFHCIVPVGQTPQADYALPPLLLFRLDTEVKVIRLGAK